MNGKKVPAFGLIVCSIFINILAGCDAATKQEEKKTVSLPLDLPKPPDIGASGGAAVARSMPEIKKSDMEFNLAADEIKKRIAESPIEDISTCVEKLKPLEEKRDAVQRYEGIWGRIERMPELKAYSPIGLRLDSKIHKLTAALRYLCVTARGVEFNETAKRIDKRRADMGDEKARAYWLDLGVFPEEVERYIEYGDFARKAKDRTLDFSSIRESMLWGELFVDRYKEFFDHRFESKENPTAAIPDALALDDAVARFLESDKNMKLASEESSRTIAYNLELEQQL